MTKRFLVDWWGNFVFFVPLVTVMSGFVIPLLKGGDLWNMDIWTSYLIASVPIAALGGPGYVLFLKHVWYPLMKERF